MTLYLLAGLFLTLCGLLWWAYRAGGRSAVATTARKGLNNARKASENREDVRRLSDADLDRELRDD